MNIVFYIENDAEFEAVKAFMSSIGLKITFGSTYPIFLGARESTFGGVLRYSYQPLDAMIENYSHIDKSNARQVTTDKFYSDFTIFNASDLLKDPNLVAEYLL